MLTPRKPLSKNGCFSPFIHNWLPVIVREPRLVHQEAYFTSGCSQEKASARFLVASLLSTPTRACIEGYVTLTQPEGKSSDERQARSRKQPLHFCFAFTLILAPSHSDSTFRCESPKLYEGRNELWNITSASVQFINSRQGKNKSQGTSKSLRRK